MSLSRFNHGGKHAPRDKLHDVPVVLVSSADHRHAARGACVLVGRPPALSPLACLTVLQSWRVPAKDWRHVRREPMALLQHHLHCRGQTWYHTLVVGERSALAGSHSTASPKARHAAVAFPGTVAASSVERCGWRCAQHASGASRRRRGSNLFVPCGKARRAMSRTAAASTLGHQPTAAWCTDRPDSREALQNSRRCCRTS